MSKQVFTLVVAVLVMFTANIFGQSSSFIYQGKLNDGALPANGNYQFVFKLYDAASSGNQIGSTITDVNATATDGIFTVNLDFGIAAYDGSPRFLDVGVRLTNSGLPYTPLTPREPVASTPYAVKSIRSDQATTADTAGNSFNLGGIPAASYVQTVDPRLSDARTPLPNSTYYIQNGETPQATSNFNISGEGKAKLFSAQTQYNIGADRVFHLTGTENTSVGIGSGNSITTASYSSFFGTNAGKSTTVGINNSFFGSYSGQDNVAGGNNAFFGSNSGLTNNSGSYNSFFGSGSGLSNFSGANNSYFGTLTGSNNSSGGNNSFFGSNAGKSADNSSYNTFVGSFSGEKTTTGSGNTFVGTFAGRQNLKGNNNTFIGYQTGELATGGFNNLAIGFNARVKDGIDNATAIGANAFANASDQTVIGGSNVYLNSVHAHDLNVSYGASVGSNLFVGGELTADQITASGWVTAAYGDFSQEVKGSYFTATSGATSNFASVNASDSLYAYRLSFGTGNVGGNTPVCMMQAGSRWAISPCSSSIRYKDNVADYKRGLDVLKRLRPVTYNWKTDGMHDVGFIAEEVNKVEPLLNTYNMQGEIEGVRYAQITTVLVNAVKEQQAQIESQRAQIAALTALVCSSNPGAEICKAIKP